ncbi:MAG: hypothetical protein K9H25_21920 [Rhodospirillum sp.]|nr:hypothetical protein [Rhodospirillum sp.]MCF8491714.1 hypothetical protein [Rhodospirillum sp.]
MSLAEWLENAAYQRNKTTVHDNYIFEKEKEILNEEANSLFELVLKEYDGGEDHAFFLEDFIRKYGNVKISGAPVQPGMFGEQLATVVPWRFAEGSLLRIGLGNSYFDTRIRDFFRDRTSMSPDEIAKENGEICEEIKNALRQRTVYTRDKKKKIHHIFQWYLIKYMTT